MAWLLSKSLWNGPCGESCVPAPSSAALGAVLLLSRQAGGTGAGLWTRWHQLALPQGAVRGFGCAAAATPLAVPGPSPPGELAEGLLQPHPLQPLLIKELIWTLLLWVSFVFRGATTGADSSCVCCRQAGDRGWHWGRGVAAEALLHSGSLLQEQLHCLQGQQRGQEAPNHNIQGNQGQWQGPREAAQGTKPGLSHTRRAEKVDPSEVLCSGAAQLGTCRTKGERAQTLPSPALGKQSQSQCQEPELGRVSVCCKG